MTMPKLHCCGTFTLPAWSLKHPAVGKDAAAGITTCTSQSWGLVCMLNTEGQHQQCNQANIDVSSLTTNLCLLKLRTQSQHSLSEMCKHLCQAHPSQELYPSKNLATKLLCWDRAPPLPLAHLPDAQIPLCACTFKPASSSLMCILTWHLPKKTKTPC